MTQHGTSLRLIEHADEVLSGYWPRYRGAGTGACVITEEALHEIGEQLYTLHLLAHTLRDLFGLLPDRRAPEPEDSSPTRSAEES